jgi:hypothetical protein
MFDVCEFAHDFTHVKTRFSIDLILSTNQSAPLECSIMGGTSTIGFGSNQFPILLHLPMTALPLMYITGIESPLSLGDVHSGDSSIPWIERLA